MTFLVTSTPSLSCLSVHNNFKSAPGHRQKQSHWQKTVAVPHTHALTPPPQGEEGKQTGMCVPRDDGPWAQR
jgi:hypothetical protein